MPLISAPTLRVESSEPTDINLILLELSFVLSKFTKDISGSPPSPSTVSKRFGALVPIPTRPPADISIVIAVIVEPPSTPLNKISLSFTID